MIEVTLYSREDCHLCELALAELNSLQERLPHKLIIVDVDEDTELRKKYGFNVPVIVVGPYTIQAPIERTDLEITLRAAMHRQEQLDKIDQDIASGALKLNLEWTKADRFSHWLAHHYLAVLNVFIFLYVGIPFLAPVFEKVGAVTPATWIYRAYGVVCHQLTFRSWFLFGEQTIYPRTAAGVEGVIPYGEATGFDESDIWAARSFIGNEQLGFKIALCERDVAIYLGILLFGLGFALSRSFLPSLPWYLWILLGIFPIGLDGFSQLLSQPPLNLLPYRESTPELRLITGFLFGFLTAWFGYPMVELSMNETKEYLETKLRRIKLQNTAPRSD
jgi:uncharacterized membrane protein